MNADSYTWSKLSHLQIGRYAEYLVKMELVRTGADVFSAEVDDKGIDFVVRREVEGEPELTYFDVQVKSIRGRGYVFMKKDRFKCRANTWLALVVFPDREPARLFLIPSTAWPDGPLLVGRDYPGLQSAPEWGVSVSNKSWPLLEKFEFRRQVAAMVGDRTAPRAEMGGPPA